MTRLCQSCGLKSCDGIECYLTDPSDYTEDEPTSTLTIADLVAKYGSQLTEMRGDPFLKARRAA